MPTVFRDRLLAGGQLYTIDCSPLEPWLAKLPDRPRIRPTLFCPNGYLAAWSVRDGTLCLAGISGAGLAWPFGARPAPVPATWFSGFIRGWRGKRRETGFPPRTFFDDEIVIEVDAGSVVREWLLDLRTVPGQTDEETRMSLPPFLWLGRLRGGAGQ